MQSGNTSRISRAKPGRVSKRQAVFVVLSVMFAVVIFCFSARNGIESTEDSYAVGMEVGRIVHPDFEEWSGDEQLTFAEKVDHPVRKLAHATEYAVFAMLLCGAWCSGHRSRKREVLSAWATATVYAMTDEFHQLFVPGRSGQVRDVLLDSCGAAVGVLLVLFVTWLIRCSGKKHNRTTGKQELSGRKTADLANKTIDN